MLTDRNVSNPNRTLEPPNLFGPLTPIATGEQPYLGMGGGGVPPIPTALGMGGGGVPPIPNALGMGGGGVPPIAKAFRRLALASTMSTARSKVTTKFFIALLQADSDRMRTTLFGGRA